jgi:hypothetical protein
MRMPLLSLIVLERLYWDAIVEKNESVLQHGAGKTMWQAAIGGTTYSVRE